MILKNMNPSSANQLIMTWRKQHVGGRTISNSVVETSTIQISTRDQENHGESDQFLSILTLKCHFYHQNLTFIQVAIYLV